MTIQQIYNSYYKHIPLGVFNDAVAADPTSYNQGKVVKVGNFVKWILKLYQNNVWKSGDSYETMDLLGKFIKYKSKLPIEKRDINRYNSVHDLYSIIQTLENKGVKSQKEVKRDGAEVVYEDSEWKIVIPYTKEASCIYGAHTKWCTAGRERNMFDYYNDKGLLYININKINGDKYQFHFKSSSFMDAEDKKISVREIGLSEGAIDYYKSIGKEPYFIYDDVWSFHNEIAVVKLDGKGWNWIDTNGELLWKEYKWFDNVKNFDNGFAIVYKKGRGWNYINTNGELLWKEYKWFNDVYQSYEGFARVYIEGRGYNFINEKGEYLWKEDKWFDDAYRFSEGFATVYKKGKGWNFINQQGEYLWGEFKNYYYVGGFINGFGWVCKEGKGCNYINTNGELLWKEDKWFDDAWSFHNEIAKVGIKGKYNYINPQGELLWKGDKWFDDACDFDNGFARVHLDGKWYKLNTNGELIKK